MKTRTRTTSGAKRAHYVRLQVAAKKSRSVSKSESVKQRKRAVAGPRATRLLKRPDPHEQHVLDLVKIVTSPNYREKVRKLEPAFTFPRSPRNSLPK